MPVIGTIVKYRVTALLHEVHARARMHHIPAANEVLPAIVVVDKAPRVTSRYS